MIGMANPEMVVLSNDWIPITAALLLVAGFLLALKMTAPSGSKGDRS
ncbi:MAG: hypothetical protein IPP78_11450 [Holophagaceae bacterium]|nr:hypothetical protein [Holophagaceae bacterium]